MTSGALRRGRRIRLAILLVVAAILAAVVAIAVTTDDEDEPELVGEFVQTGEPLHTNDAAAVVAPPGDPPAGGPHFPLPLPAGAYDQPVEDGRAVHSLEHGMIWITYNPRIVDEGDLEDVRRIGREFARDVIVSPRPANSRPVIAVSWGRILRMDGADADALRHFIEVNRDRSPEPGIR